MSISVSSVHLFNGKFLDKEPKRRHTEEDERGTVPVCISMSGMPPDSIIWARKKAMTKTPPDFQIFAKPVSYRCNLHCSYCYYLRKESIFPTEPAPQMTEDLLEKYIRGHIEAYPGNNVRFSWHGGEPTLLGIDRFRRIIELQQKHCPTDKHITNGIQTNGTLLTDDWGRFLAEHRFTVGLSLDGPEAIHDVYRTDRLGQGSHAAAMRGYRVLADHRIPTDILCVVNGHNVMFPLQVYRFFKSIGATHLSFLPLVEPLENGVSDRTVPPEEFGAFLCTIFDEWRANDIGTVKVQIFEEAARAAFGQDHSLCLFRPTCGDIPVVEAGGDVYACDHFVEPGWWVGNIADEPLAEILGSERLRRFGAAKRTSLPQSCRSCEVLAMCNGECPKNRFVTGGNETEKLNYLCAGYKLFFNHCTPFVQAVARQWRQQSQTDGRPGHTGRNDPCPCGSGRKYKKCCGRK